MLAVTDRDKLPRSFRPQRLTTQAGCHGLHVEAVTLSMQFTGQTQCPVALFCPVKSLVHGAVATQTELLADLFDG